MSFSKRSRSRSSAEAGDGAEALTLLHNLGECGGLPDMVLMDLAMPFLDGVAATRRITHSYPGVRVVILTGFDLTHRVAAALADGAEGYLVRWPRTLAGSGDTPPGSRRGWWCWGSLDGGIAVETVEWEWLNRFEHVG
ncbi:response regulator transcription factor [Nocardia sp. NPDC005366]|uniref:response regulator n=1 Tax=Nocardia sp. NPDC005366 TaxID=3156878 RepID=UPI00339E0D3B